MKYLGEAFDIHGGGRDLIFPHHENEIAQSEGVTGSPFVRYWLHHGLITVNEQKMSKSLKNYITLSDIATRSKHGIEEIKFLFLGTHYSMPLDYSEERMEMEKAVHERFLYFLRDLSELSRYKNCSPRTNGENKRFETAFKEAMEDDFNTPQALAVMHEMVHYARKVQDPAIELAVGEQMRKFGKILGLSFPLMLHFHDNIEITAEVRVLIEDLVKEREEAKKRKDFKTADKIRNEILKKYKVELIDTKEGTQRRKVF
jgi:cysteinyl-tRNA synthetase